MALGRGAVHWVTSPIFQNYPIPLLEEQSHSTEFSQLPFVWKCSTLTLLSSSLCSFSSLSSSPCSSISILLCFSKTISVKVIDDEEYEKNKTFFLEIGEPRLVEMSEKKGGGAAPGQSPTASAGLCHPWMPALFRRGSQHTHPSTYVTGHRSHPRPHPHPQATAGPAWGSISQF